MGSVEPLRCVCPGTGPVTGSPRWASCSWEVTHTQRLVSTQGTNSDTNFRVAVHTADRGMLIRSRILCNTGAEHAETQTPGAVRLNDNAQQVRRFRQEALKHDIIL